MATIDDGLKYPVKKLGKTFFRPNMSGQDQRWKLRRDLELYAKSHEQVVQILKTEGIFSYDLIDESLVDLHYLQSTNIMEGR